VRNALPGFHLEVKRYARFSVLRHMDQAKEDCAAREANGEKKLRPLVLLREDRDTNWYALVSLSDIEDLLFAYQYNRGQK